MMAKKLDIMSYFLYNTIFLIYSRAATTFTNVSNKNHYMRDLDEGRRGQISIF
jgi:hypothetical protein